MTDRKRLSRAESQQLTRKAIVASASRLFLEHGYRATSLEEIAEDAGFTRGAVYSNFASKTAMGVAVVDALYEAEMGQAIAIFAKLAELGTDTWLDQIGAWAQRSFGDPRWARLEAEIAAFSSAEDGLREATGARYARLRGQVSDALTEAAAQGGIELPFDIALMSLAIVSLGLGLGAQRASDPSLAGSAYAEMLRMFVPRSLAAISPG